MDFTSIDQIDVLSQEPTQSPLTKTYTFKSDPAKNVHLGVFHDELDQIIPNVVKEDGTVDPQSLFAFLFNEVHNLRTEIEKLQLQEPQPTDTTPSNARTETSERPRRRLRPIEPPITVQHQKPKTKSNQQTKSDK